MIERPGQAVATSNNFALTSLSYSARSSILGRPCYSRSIHPHHGHGADRVTIVNISKTFAITSTTISAHESYTSHASPSSVMSARLFKHLWYWMYQMLNQITKRTRPPPSPKTTTNPFLRGNVRRGLGGFISVDYFRWCCKTPRRNCSSRHSQ